MKQVSLEEKLAFYRESLAKVQYKARKKSKTSLQLAFQIDSVDGSQQKAIEIGCKLKNKLFMLFISLVLKSHEDYIHLPAIYL
jgi:hypothetical protein